MQETEIEEFRQKLIHLGSELRSLEETSKKTTKPVELDQASVDRLSRMDAMQKASKWRWRPHGAEGRNL